MWQKFNINNIVDKFQEQEQEQEQKQNNTTFGLN